MYPQIVILFLLSLAATVEAATVTEVYPDIWMITNHAGGLTDYDYFSIFTYEFPYMGISINGVHFNKYRRIDREHYDLAKKQLYSTADHDGVHMMSWKFPRSMPVGQHELAIFCSEKDDPTEREGVMLLLPIQCESVPVALLPESLYPRLCKVMPEGSRLREPID